MFSLFISPLLLAAIISIAAAADFHYGHYAADAMPSFHYFFFFFAACRHFAFVFISMLILRHILLMPLFYFISCHAPGAPFCCPPFFIFAFTPLSFDADAIFADFFAAIIFFRFRFRYAAAASFIIFRFCQPPLFRFS